MKIIFIIPSVSDSHYKNRILEFIQNGFDVYVYGFSRKGHNCTQNLPYPIEMIGELEDEGYLSRLKLYFKEFGKIVRRYNNQSVLFYVGGLDIAMFFHFLFPRLQYIYEECDLVHTYLGRAKYFLEIIDKIVIRKSFMTVTTSEGFIDYHFNGQKPDNVFLIENRLDPSVLKLSRIKKHPFIKENISFGFVGKPRFDSVLNFIQVVCRTFPQHTVHIFGGPVEPQFRVLEKYSNCIFHGFFNNPYDLPEIYSKIDFVLSTYDAGIENVCYAEPNKIYESIFFETPIIVSKNTFLEKKVQRLGIGYSVDALNDKEIIDFVSNISEDNVNDTIGKIQAMDKTEAINFNDEFFACLKNRLESNFRKNITDNK